MLLNVNIAFKEEKRGSNPWRLCWNYKFVVQDEVQSFHWNNLQCTLPPVVVYYRADGKLLHMSYCIISDDMTHDIAMVYKIQKCIIAAIKSKLPYIVKVEYYSDGSAGQYKNCKNFSIYANTKQILT